MLFFLVTEPRLAFTLGILSPRAAPALTPFSARRKEPGKGEQPNGRELWFSSGWGISPSHPLDPARASSFIASPEKSLRPCWVSPPPTRFPLVLNAIFTFLDFLGEGFRGSINFASSGVEGADVWHGAPPERWLDLEAKLQMVVFLSRDNRANLF